MGMIKTAVHTQLFDLPSLVAVFDRLNEVLPSVKEPHTCTPRSLRFASSRTNPIACRVDYAIGGQPPMLHASAATAAASQLADQQLPLGLLAAPAYKGQSVELTPGDLLLIATDGILEAETNDGVEFGLDRLGSLLVENRTRPLATIAQAIHAALWSTYIQTDDQSLLLIRVIS
jgi:serine phosphatase RsbU (regulator of sigma subunit)